MVSKGYASKIIAYDDNTVDMFIKPENIVDVFGKDANKVGRSPSVNVKIGSMEALDKFLDEEQDRKLYRFYQLRKKQLFWYDFSGTLLLSYY